MKLRRMVLGAMAVVVAVVAAVGIGVAAGGGKDDEKAAAGKAMGGEAVKVVTLPAAKMSGGMPLMEALKNRKTDRAFAEKALPMEVLSNLLWAANGVNRAESGKRTAPSAVNWQEVDIYVATADGTYLYDAKAHALRVVSTEDVRGLTGGQGFVKGAPVNLVFVADFAKMGRASDADKVLYSAADTGFISQNVYLFCASEGLATVVRGMVNREALGKALGLRADQRIILAQTVGYPK